MKVVWITRQDFRRADGGANLYSRGLLNGLRAHGVTTLPIGYAAPGMAPAENIFAVPERWRPLSIFSPLQSDAWRLQSPEFAAAAIGAITADVDAVVLDYFSVGWLLPAVRRRLAELGPKRPVLVHSTHNHEKSVRSAVAAAHRPPMKYALAFDAWKAARLEHSLLDAADVITSNTDADKELFRKDAPSKIHVTLTPAYDGPQDIGPDLTAAIPRRVVKIGNLDWVAKRESFRRFVASAEKPFAEAGIELVVAGKADPAYVEDIQSRSKICRFTGFVDDLTELLRSSRIGLMSDELGGGFKHRFLHYIFLGVPVASIRGQTTGLPFDPATGMILGEDSPDLVANIVAAIDDIDRLNHLRQVAYRGIEGKFDWASRGAALIEAITQAKAKIA